MINSPKVHIQGRFWSMPWDHHQVVVFHCIASLADVMIWFNIESSWNIGVALESKRNSYRGIHLPTDVVHVRKVISESIQRKRRRECGYDANNNQMWTILTLCFPQSWLAKAKGTYIEWYVDEQQTLSWGEHAISSIYWMVVIFIGISLSLIPNALQHITIHFTLVMTHQVRTQRSKVLSVSQHSVRTLGGKWNGKLASRYCDTMLHWKHCIGIDSRSFTRFRQSIERHGVMRKNYVRSLVYLMRTYTSLIITATK